MSDSSKSATAGAVSGMTARVITTPLDVIKIRFQLQLEPVRGEVRLLRHEHNVNFCPNLSRAVMYLSIEVYCKLFPI